MNRILVADPIHEKGLELFRGNPDFQVEIRPAMDEETLCREIPEYHGLIVRSTTRVTRRVIEAGKNLRIVGRAGVGMDNVDVEAARERGIETVNAPTGNVRTAVEHTFALILALARNVPRGDRRLREKRWNRGELKGFELEGKTLGIFGLGKVGSGVAKLAVCFGMNVVGADPEVPPQRIRELGIEPADPDAVLSRADVLTLHLPLTPQTAGLIGPQALSKMKRTTVLINTSRGEVVDEKALIEALREKRIAGAALDVYAREPLGDSPLLDLPNVVLTPHIGGLTEEAHIRVAEEVCRRVIRFFGLTKEPPES